MSVRLPQRRLAAFACFSGVMGMLITLSTVAAASAPPGPPGGVYVSDVTGTTTNPSSFATVADVYLEAAPCSPVTGDPLPAGGYYFDVADETGTISLSDDALSQRRFEVGPSGVIVGTGAGSAHSTAPNSCGSQAGGLTVQVQPFGDLPAGQHQYTLRITTQAAADGCTAAGSPDGFCDPTAILAGSFAIAPNLVSPVPSGTEVAGSPADSVGASAIAEGGSPVATPSAATSASADATASASPSGPAPASGSPADTNSPRPSVEPTPTPSRTPGPMRTPVPRPAATTAPGGTGRGGHEPIGSGAAGGGGGGGTTWRPPVQTPIPTFIPFVLPSGFYNCKPTEVVTSTGCKTEAQVAAEVPAGPAGQPGASTGTGVPMGAGTAGAQGGAGSGSGSGTPAGVASGASGEPQPSGSGMAAYFFTFPPNWGESPAPAGALAAAGAPGAPAASVDLPSQPGVVAPATGDGRPPAAAQNIAGVSASPADGVTSAAATRSSGDDRTIGVVAIVLFAIIAIGLASIVSRIARRRRPA